jgi:hypothetical protein
MLNEYEKKTIQPHLLEKAQKAREAANRLNTEGKYRIRVEFGCGNTAFVVAELHTADIYDVSKQVVVHKGISFDLSLINPDTSIPEIARDALRLLTGHEVDEWLMLDGKQVNPPHKEKRPEINVHHGSEILQVTEWF